MSISFLSHESHVSTCGKLYWWCVKLINYTSAQVVSYITILNTIIKSSETRSSEVIFWSTSQTNHIADVSQRLVLHAARVAGHNRLHQRIFVRQNLFLVYVYTCMTLCTMCVYVIGCVYHNSTCMLCTRMCVSLCVRACLRLFICGGLLTWVQPTLARVSMKTLKWTMVPRSPLGTECSGQRSWVRVKDQG